MMEERNKSAAFGTGAFPPDDRSETDWRESNNGCSTRSRRNIRFACQRAAQRAGRKTLRANTAQIVMGATAGISAATHVGDVVPIDKIGTDRHRLDSVHEELAAAQNTHLRRLSVALQPFPQDLWLRQFAARRRSGCARRICTTALSRRCAICSNPSAERPSVFYRGYDVFDQVKRRICLATSSQFDDEGRSRDDPTIQEKYFRFDTQVKPGRPDTAGSERRQFKRRPRRPGLRHDALCCGERRRSSNI